MYLLFLSCLCTTSWALLDSEPHTVARLFQKEEEIIQLLSQLSQLSLYPTADTYLASCQPRIDELPLSSSIDDILKHLVGNPVHVFCLVDRTVRSLPAVVSRLQEEVTVEQGEVMWGELEKQVILNQKLDLMESLQRYMATLTLPTMADLGSVSQALARIQFAYRLDPVDLSWGYIQDVQTKARMSVEQMFTVAQSRYEGLYPLRRELGREYALAYEWTEAALDRVRREGLGWEWDRHLSNYMFKVRNEHDIHWKSPVGQRGTLPNEEFFVEPVGEGRQGEVWRDGRRGRGLRYKEEEFLSREPYQNSLPLGYSLHDFYALCRGESINRVVATVDPHCYLTHRGDPYFLLAPLRQEVVSAHPLLLLYHNLLTEQEMDYMTDKVMSSMEVATVVDYAKAGGKVSMERSQASGWLWDHHHPILYKLARKVARLTGLETHRPKELLGLNDGEWEEAEAWQMGLYGPGGHYLPHFDAFDSLDFLAFSNEGSGKVWRGNRMATIMFYLTDLVGGATAFPNLGVAARPRRGTGVFWYNMWEDGDRIPESLHGACPTALGIKWVSNKWIREGAQLWKRPCLAPKNNTLL